MYETFFGLNRRPFSATPNPSCFAAIASAQAAFDELVVCAESGQGIAIVTAPAGTGKTLICERLVAELADSYQTVFLATANYPTRRSLLQAIVYELGQPYHKMAEQELRLTFLEAVKRVCSDKQAVVLVIDEAHLLGEQLLEEIRTLTNLSSGAEPLVRVVLSGQLPLEERLASNALEALNQRIRCHVSLEPLTRSESADYIAHRLEWAGGTMADVFTTEAILLAVQASDGVPRCLNQLCDHSLLLAYVAEQKPVDEDIVREALDDLKQLPLHWNDVAASYAPDEESSLENDDQGAAADASIELACDDRSVQECAPIAEPSENAEFAEIGALSGGASFEVGATDDGEAPDEVLSDADADSFETGALDDEESYNEVSFDAGVEADRLESPDESALVDEYIDTPAEFELAWDNVPDGLPSVAMTNHEPGEPVLAFGDCETEPAAAAAEAAEEAAEEEEETPALAADMGAGTDWDAHSSFSTQSASGFEPLAVGCFDSLTAGRSLEDLSSELSEPTTPSEPHDETPSEPIDGTEPSAEEPASGEETTDGGPVATELEEEIVIDRYAALDARLQSSSVSGIVWEIPAREEDEFAAPSCRETNWEEPSRLEPATVEFEVSGQENTFEESGEEDGVAASGPSAENGEETSGRDEWCDQEPIALDAVREVHPDQIIDDVMPLLQAWDADWSVSSEASPAAQDMENTEDTARNDRVESLLSNEETGDDLDPTEPSGLSMEGDVQSQLVSQTIHGNGDEIEEDIGSDVLDICLETQQTLLDRLDAVDRCAGQDLPHGVNFDTEDGHSSDVEESSESFGVAQFDGMLEPGDGMCGVPEAYDVVEPEPPSPKRECGSEIDDRPRDLPATEPRNRQSPAVSTSPAAQRPYGRLFSELRRRQQCRPQ